MPILRKRADGGYILKGFVRAAHGFCTWQLSDEGIGTLHGAGYASGTRVPHELFQQLVEGGHAFTGKSGVTETVLTPASLEEEPTDAGTNPVFAKIDADSARLLDRWLPRLTDRSSDVREKAAAALGKLAVKSPSCREQLVALLLDFAVQEEQWHVVLNGLLFKGEFSSVPKIDPKWLELFVEAYLEMGAIPDDKQSGGWRELQELVEEGHVAPASASFRRIVSVAKQALNGAEDDARSHIFAVLDWAEDNA